MTRKQSELDGASNLARSGTSSLPNQAAMHDRVDRQASGPLFRFMFVTSSCSNSSRLQMCGHAMQMIVHA